MRLLRHDKHIKSPKCNLFASHNWTAMLRWPVVVCYYIVVVGAIYQGLPLIIPSPVYGRIYCEVVVGSRAHVTHLLVGLGRVTTRPGYRFC